MPEVERMPHPWRQPTTTWEEASPQLERSCESCDSSKEGISMATGEEVLVPLYWSRIPSTLHNSSGAPSPLLQLLKNPKFPATI